MYSLCMQNHWAYFSFYVKNEKSKSNPISNPNETGKEIQPKMRHRYPVNYPVRFSAPNEQNRTSNGVDVVRWPKWMNVASRSPPCSNFLPLSHSRCLPLYLFLPALASTCKFSCKPPRPPIPPCGLAFGVAHPCALIFMFLSSGDSPPTHEREREREA